MSFDIRACARPHHIDHPRRVLPLAACIAAALALSLTHASPVAAATITVTNCSDHDSGSLRTAVAAAHSGDTVDLSSLAPCTITLTTAAIPIGVASLYVQGPTTNSVAISGNGAYRVFDHSGTGTLSLYHLTVENGKYRAPNAKGGCIVSAGAVTLVSSTVSGCNAYASTGHAQGGGIYAPGKLTLTNSTLSGNVSQSTNGAYGGGARAGSATLRYATLQNNTAMYPTGSSPAGGAFRGGGLFVNAGTLDVENSVLEGNLAKGRTASGGGVHATASATISSTTISSCQAYSAQYGVQGGGVYVSSALTLTDSMVSDNTGAGAAGAYGGGIRAGSLVAHYDTIHGNSVTGSNHGFSGYFEGGGVFVYQGTTDLENSTIDGNSTLGLGGGIFGVHSAMTVKSSTISGNTASGDGKGKSAFGAGIAMAGGAARAASIKLYNSTIAFNSVASAFGPYGGAGLRAYGSATVQSSIIANNTKHGVPSDFSCNCGLDAAPDMTGFDNLVMAVDPAGTTPPAGLILLSADPALVPLSNHGGPTRTHALTPYSPAIGLGNNSDSFPYDQRGAGFPRTNGGKADIGAYERQPNDDEIFYDGFGPGGG